MEATSDERTGIGMSTMYCHTKPIQEEATAPATTPPQHPPPAPYSNKGTVRRGSQSAPPLFPAFFFLFPARTPAPRPRIGVGYCNSPTGYYLFWFT